ncbi:MAG: hypothetical protein Salg2KO_03940 [Salibacteraceae bacterium]
MKHSYTQHSLLTDFVYSESDELQTEIEMTERQSGPSEWTIQKILGFSKALNVSRSSMIGDMEQIQN